MVIGLKRRTDAVEPNSVEWEISTQEVSIIGIFYRGEDYSGQHLYVLKKRVKVNIEKVLKKKKIIKLPEDVQ